MTESQRRATKKWNDANMKDRYYRVSALLPMAQKDKLITHVNNRGESISGFINRAIDETMERDGEEQ